MAPIKLEESDACMRARLVQSLSRSFPGSALSRALRSGGEVGPDFSDSAGSEDEDDDALDTLSQSCFSQIRLDKGQPEAGDGDEELTSLSWLQDSDLLKNLSGGCPLDDVKEDTPPQGQPHPPHIPYNPQKHVNSKPPYSFSCLIFMAIEDSPVKKLPVKDIYNWILTNFPYFQNAPTGWKNSVRHNLSLNKCFKKVEKEKGQGIGKGSLWCIDPDFRPNLLQALRKTPYHPYHQLQMVSSSNSPQPPGFNVISDRDSYSTQFNVNSPSPHLFPFLSRRLAQSKSDVPASDDIDVANTLVSLKRAALVRSSRAPLRTQNGWGGQRSRSPSPPEFGSEQEKLLLREKTKSSRLPLPSVVTRLPSEDHTYSMTQRQLQQLTAPPASGGKRSPSIDGEYEFGSDSDEMRALSDAEDDDDDDEDASDAGLGRSHGSDLAAPFKLRLVLRQPGDGKREGTSEEEEEEEKSKIEEGAEALLNLAGIVTNNNNNNNNEVKRKRKREEDMDLS